MDDPEITDVTAMGQVNLNKESTLILTAARRIGEEKRSCGEILYVVLNMMQSRVNSHVKKLNLDVPAVNVTLVMSIALQERIKYLVSKLISIYQHRNISHRMSPLYKTVDDVKAKLKIVEEIERIQEKKEKNRQNEFIIKTAASKSKDPEQAKLKDKAKAIQKAEQDAVLYNQANMTALQAIGRRKIKRERVSFITIHNKIYKITNPARQTVFLKKTKRVKRMTMKEVCDAKLFASYAKRHLKQTYGHLERFSAPHRSRLPVASATSIFEFFAREERSSSSLCMYRRLRSEAGPAARAPSSSPRYGAELANMYLNIGRPRSEAGPASRAFLIIPLRGGVGRHRVNPASQL